MIKTGFIKFFLLLIIALFISYHIYYKYDDVNIDESHIIYKEEKISTNMVEKINNTKDQNIGFIEIPKIKLKKELYSINSSENTVNKNVTIIKGSSMPNIKNSYLILAAHSGNSSLSYFKNLHLLEINDEVIIYYNNKRYYYSAFDIYEINKNGYINFNRNVHENILILTTCSKEESKQLVIKLKLINTI